MLPRSARSLPFEGCQSTGCHHDEGGATARALGRDGRGRGGASASGQDMASAPPAAARAARPEGWASDQWAHADRGAASDRADPASPTPATGRSYVPPWHLRLQTDSSGLDASSGPTLIGSSPNEDRPLSDCENVQPRHREMRLPNQVLGRSRIDELTKLLQQRGVEMGRYALQHFFQVALQ